MSEDKTKCMLCTGWKKVIWIAEDTCSSAVLAKDFRVLCINFFFFNLCLVPNAFLKIQCVSTSLRILPGFPVDLTISVLILVVTAILLNICLYWRISLNSVLLPELLLFPWRQFFSVHVCCNLSVLLWVLLKYGIMCGYLFIFKDDVVERLQWALQVRVRLFHRKTSG